ncbi:hypothetical protein E2C01_080042 [Portunus trituberculatus]|uniref:Uncharacterized protein n=1 Tax=Portunus trituberculatus TaxID=210409 RepID=A0A5B7IUD6_PORTR|nr:hypothetical protein [Portunus trituberculatus]
MCLTRRSYVACLLHSLPAPACLLGSLLPPLLSNHQGQWVAEAVNCCDACDALVSPLQKVTDGNPIIFTSSSGGVEGGILGGTREEGMEGSNNVHLVTLPSGSAAPLKPQHGGREKKPENSRHLAF